jgi:hypothetical protein
MMAPYVNSYRRLTPDMAARSTPPGATTTARPRSACRHPDRRRGGWKTGCRRRTPIPTWRWRRRWPAAISAWSMGWCRRARRLQTANEGAISLPRGLLEAVSLLESGARFRRSILGREFTATLCRRQARRVRDLHAGDQPVGTRIPAAQRLRNVNHDLPKPDRPGCPGTRRRRRAARISGARRRHDCDVRDRRRRLHRAAARPIIWRRRQGRGADRRRALRRRRVGPQWRAAEHRPARLAGGKQADFGFERARRCSPGRAGEDASARLRRNPRSSTPITGRARSRPRTRSAMSRTTAST